MKTFKLSLLVIATALFFSCDDDDDNPVQINPEELITSVTLVLESPSGNVTLSATDVDGFEGPSPVVTTTNGGNLQANTTYTVTSISLLDSSDPNDIENITDEIEEEADEHQFFYQISGLDATASYTDSEADYDDDSDSDLPVGLSFTLVTGDASSGTFTLTLRHELDKEAAGVDEGDITNAGGETDTSVTWNLVIE
ncbi:hypothetical protein GCM10009117_00930 [Gangjinia marincola]|uniref:Type 1 periplasmic binding fold superfamily protein n=1 Tax=Gangjinia marincola TaxID=578463 RepID=A0ABN1MD55_9FLAO